MRTISDANAVIAERYSYDVYGEAAIYDENGSEITDSNIGNPYMFTGRRYDPETGLYYYRARYYSAAIGRFLQTDPIGYEDGLNLYTYVRNNPVNRIDPGGTAIISLPALGIIIVLGVVTYFMVWRCALWGNRATDKYNALQRKYTDRDGCVNKKRAWRELEKTKEYRKMKSWCFGATISSYAP